MPSQWEFGPLSKRTHPIVQERCENLNVGAAVGGALVGRGGYPHLPVLLAGKHSHARDLVPVSQPVMRPGDWSKGVIRTGSIFSLCEHSGAKGPTLSVPAPWFREVLWDWGW